ncbi:MAG TPA: CCA tRNA nucleotidyltransferase [Terriglobales bacterium]|nr:CCA tRNA nucleotidyltransferase [Terriglobales bacterium]
MENRGPAGQVSALLTIMADYIYTMESRLSPDQLKGVTLVQDVARAAGMNVYLTGGAIRDMISGLPIRDLDFTVQGNALRLQKDLEKAGVRISNVDDDVKSLLLVLPGNVRAEIGMARLERYEKTGKPPLVTPATIIEDLRRRDFTVNAMALSLNPGSRGLLMDPFNGAADIEAKLLRVLHNYAFVEDPSRLIRASRFAARFHWPLEERTQARYDSARENNYIEYITDKAIGYEIAQLAYEDDPLHIIRVLEKDGWLKILNPHWSTAKVDAANLAQLMKMRQQMNELGYSPDPAPAVLYFLTARLGDKDIADIRKRIPRKDLVEGWRDLEENAKELSKKLMGKEAATPSRAWKVLSDARPEMVLFLSVTARQQAVAQKLKNFFTKWRQVQQKIPLPEMTELLITPQLPEYPKIAHDVFMLLLDGKLRSRTEILKFLKPFAPPPPPPPPAPKRGRAAKAAASGGNGAAPAAQAGKKKGKAEAVVVAAQAAVKRDVSARAGKQEKKAPPQNPAKPVAKAAGKKSKAKKRP